MPAKKPTPDEKPQFERFIEAAKKAEAAETDEALPRLIQKIAPSIKGRHKRKHQFAKP
jgi:hypothetical protein